MERVPSTNMNNSTMPRQAGGGRTFKIKDYLFLCLSNWYWFVLCLIVAFAVAWLYLKKTPNVYSRTMSILVKVDQRGRSTDNTLRALGITDYNSSVDNEILALKTYDLALKVSRRLNLKVSYWHKGFFHDEVVYGVDLPITVKFFGLNDNESASVHVRLNADSTFVVSNLRRGKEEYNKAIKAHLGRKVETPLCEVEVSASPYYKKGATDDIEVRRTSVGAAANAVRSRISAGLRDKLSTIIDVSYRDVSPSRAEDVLNTLIAVYDENWMKDRNQITVSTNEFIRDRLAAIEEELGNVEQNISSYKSAHLVTNVDQVGSMAMNKANAVEQESSDLGNQIYMVRYIRNYLSDGQHEDRLLPSNSGINSLSIGGQINEYNNLLLTRNNHLANSSLQNPLVIDMDEQLASMRHSIIQSLDNELAILNEQQRTLQSNYGSAVSKIASNPGQAKYLLSVERQQKVKESLYLFLLQKREENELSQAFTAYNTQLIESPHGGMTPISPVPNSTYMFALLLGLCVPAVFFLGKEALNTTVRSRKDLEQMKVPYVGDIPYVGDKKALRLVKKGKKKDTHEIVVKENSRNSINEAFRVIRTNLEFVLGFDSGHHVIMFTSMHPDAGKTFISANLSTAVGIKDKKVLAIDLDLRKGSLSEYVGKPKKGISNYLSGQVADYRELIVKEGKVDVLPCGTLPPNPTELLFVPKFERLMTEVRQEYDYVFVDCPPVDIVADAAIINRHVDLSVFVVRAGMMELSMLTEIDRWYEEKKYKNMVVILNGTESGAGYYKYGRYGYGRYGYGQYGYGNRKG